ncbi:MAG: endonuclease domain-containing protein [Bacteroidales bacterium]|nr:endonuclease domain-containing protein [Bacteroidales bacterium]
MKYIHNRKELKTQRKYLRNHATSAEAVFWRYLKNKQVGGLKFRRQHSIGPFIVDFYCPELRLAVELDGAPHISPYGENYDANREKYLRNLGVIVIRFENKYVFDYPMDIVEMILNVKQLRISQESI